MLKGVIQGMIKSMCFITCVIFLIACKEKDAEVKVVPLTATQQLLVNELNTLIQPITSADPSLSFDDLRPLDDLSDAKIVGMGEATHGTKEFFQMKHRIFSYLVQKHHFKAIAFEMDFAEAMIFEDYIQGRNTENLESLMKTKMLLWPWKTGEVAALINWMKNYNNGKSDADRIHFLGFDCQLPTYNADFLVTKVAAVDHSLSDYINNQLIIYKKIFFAGDKDTTNYKAIERSVVNVYNKLLEQKANLITKGMSLTDYETCKRLGRTIVQVYYSTAGLKGIGTPGFIYRDFYMAENALWIQRSLGVNEKICLWAHNNHINDDSGRMGAYIADSLSANYKKIGFGFTHGQFNSFNSQQQLTVFSYEIQPPSGTLNFIFKNSASPNFYLDLKQVPNPGQFFDWTNNPHDLFSAGGTYDGRPQDNYRLTFLNQYFDSFIYFEKSSSSDFLK